jgi:ribosomal protein S18 acetylase RimI-like enzyme
MQGKRVPANLGFELRSARSSKLRLAREMGAPELYLTVFDHNDRAKRFYLRHGFAEVGQCTFELGDRIDDDRIWRRRIC